MKLIMKIVERLKKNLNEWVDSKKIKDYQLILQIDSSIELKLLVESEIDEDDLFIFEDLRDYEDRIYISQISVEDYERDSFLESVSLKDKVNFHLRRRFQDLINPLPQVDTPCPVVTFYSYKGGVGRTTLLACFAQYLASQNKQVIIIDCDFEAPGFTNYFGYRFGEETQVKYGVMEYLLDRQFLESKDDEFIKEKLISQIEHSYSYQVGSEYTDGEIRVIKAGNYESNNIHDYLESLSRLDINNVSIFKEFLEDLKTAFNLTWEKSIILIDSRTGFNDTFATLYALSQIVVGVFGTNTQSTTGLNYILDTFLRIDEEMQTQTEKKEFLFVQSFNSSERNRNGLLQLANDFFEAHPENFGFQNGKNPLPHQNRFFQFSEDKRLAEIGENSTLKEREIEIHDFINYRLINSEGADKLFPKLIEVIENQVKKKLKTDSQEVDSPSTDKQIKEKDSQFDEVSFRKSIIENIKIPNIRAEAIRNAEKNKDFYFRKGMSDIFNPDKFIIAGSKGTGKTMIYEVMGFTKIQKELCQRENKNYEDYFFVNILPVIDNNNAEVTQQHFNTNRFTDEDKKGINNFFERFWIIYIAIKVFSNEHINSFTVQNDFDLSWLFQIENSTDCSITFAKNIRDNDAFAKIERQLFTLNKQLAKKNKRLLIFLDQLDFVVPPFKWDEGISALVGYWRTNPFSHIYPKIFLRSDLMRTKLRAVNSTELFRRSIKIEWTKEELFAYFFTVQIYNNPKDLIKYFENKGIDNNIISCLQRSAEHYTQLDDERDILEPLVNAFFGRSAHKFSPNDTVSFGIAYDWFVKNIQDGNDDVSLRPFLWLIEKAKESSLLDSKYSKDYILGAKHFADFKTVEYAGEKYYEDLTKEEGNAIILDPFSRFLRENRNIKRKGNYLNSEFTDLINLFIKEFPDVVKEKNSNESNFEYIKNFLVNNGIVREVRKSGGKYINYEIPFMYKYYLLFHNA